MTYNLHLGSRNKNQYGKYYSVLHFFINFFLLDHTIGTCVCTYVTYVPYVYSIVYTFQLHILRTDSSIFDSKFFKVSVFCTFINRCVSNQLKPKLINRFHKSKTSIITPVLFFVHPGCTFTSEFCVNGCFISYLPL